MSTSCLVAWLLLIAASGAQAQVLVAPRGVNATQISSQSVESLRAARLFRTLSPPMHSSPATRILPPAPDYRWEGLAIGGIALGGVGGLLANHFCNDPDSGSGRNCAFRTIEGLLFGATVGGVTGGLLGGLIPKGHSAASRDSTQ